MGLLDIDIKIDAVVNEGLAWKPTASWMKQLIAEPTNSRGPIDMWVRYDEGDKILVNLLGEDKFRTDDVMTIETLIEEWFNASKRWDVIW